MISVGQCRTVSSSQRIELVNTVPKNHWRDKFELKSKANVDSVKRNGFLLQKATETIRFEVRDLLGPVKGLSILDAGCGDGSVSAPLASDNNVVGLDISPGMLELASMRGLVPTLGSFENPPFEAESFDAVLCVESATLSDTPLATLRALAALVKPGGILIVSSVNRQSIARRLAEGALDILGRPYPNALTLTEIMHEVGQLGFKVLNQRCVIAAPGWARGMHVEDDGSTILKFANNIIVRAQNSGAPS